MSRGKSQMFHGEGDTSSEIFLRSRSTMLVEMEVENVSFRDFVLHFLASFASKMEEGLKPQNISGGRALASSIQD